MKQTIGPKVINRNGNEGGYFSVLMKDRSVKPARACKAQGLDREGSGF